MRSEMPVKYWKNLPEAPLIAELVRDAGRRTATMIEAEPTAASRRSARDERERGDAGGRGRRETAIRLTASAKRRFGCGGRVDQAASRAS